MSQSNIQVSGERRLATEQRSRVDANGVTYVEHFQHTVPSAIGAVAKLLSAYLGGDDPDMDVDGSTTEVEFDLAPSSSQIYRIDRLSVLIVSATAMEMTEFGDIAALTDGLELSWLDEDGEVVDLTGGHPIKSLNDLAALGSVQVLALTASYTARVVIDLPTPIRLDGGAGGTLRATVSDNLTGLTRLRIHALGAVEVLV